METQSSLFTGSSYPKPVTFFLRTSNLDFFILLDISFILVLVHHLQNFHLLTSSSVSILPVRYLNRTHLELFLPFLNLSNQTSLHLGLKDHHNEVNLLLQISHLQNLPSNLLDLVLDLLRVLVVLKILLFLGYCPHLLFEAKEGEQ